MCQAPGTDTIYPRTVDPPYAERRSASGEAQVHLASCDATRVCYLLVRALVEQEWTADAADLREANLFGARLDGSTLDGTKIEGANFDGAKAANLLNAVRHV